MNPTPNNAGHYLKAKIPLPDVIEKIQRVHWLTKQEFVEQHHAFHFLY